jgi:DNA-binding NtrC family response regulator
MNGETIRLCVFGPDAAFWQVIARALGAGFELRIEQPAGSEEGFLSNEGWDAVLLDLRAGEDSAGVQAGLEHLERFQRMEFAPPVIVLLDEDDRSLHQRAMDLGAYDTLTGPLHIAELRLGLRRAYRFRKAEEELRQLRSQTPSGKGLPELIGFCESMQKVFALAHKAGPCDVTVLVMGETGTGKGLLARALHQLSPRAGAPLVSFSCANLPEQLVEDELFGHERGAFTGAISMRRGRMEIADRGTLFLDEIGDLGLGLQSKLLRVLQERCFERLGSNTPIHSNFRLLCATHRNLAEMVEKGEFREDLFYRLNVVQIHLPPLRERREEIPVLAAHFLDSFARQFGKNTHRFSRNAMHALEEYEWPGNVRELENVVQRAVVMTEGHTVELGHLPGAFRSGFLERQTGSSYEEEVRQFKRRLLLRALQECGWCKVETAKRLGVARSYLHRLIAQLQISAQETSAGRDSAEGQECATAIM